jgi:hypothetical protein
MACADISSMLSSVCAIRKKEDCDWGQTWHEVALLGTFPAHKFGSGHLVNSQW